MRTKLIYTLKKDLLIIELPEHGGYNLNKNRIAFYDNFKKERLHIKGYYTLLGAPDEISEEDVKELVELGDADPVGDRFVLGYRSYFEGYEDDVPQFTCNTALESFHSALESEIYLDVNPFKKPENYNLWAKYGDFTQYGVGLTTESFKWHEAQEKTFDKNRTLIFVKQ